MGNDYWRKENPRYIELLLKIEEKQHRIDSRIIRNPRTLRFAKRDIKNWKKELKNTKQYID